MYMLWDFPKELHRPLVGLHLIKYGPIIGETYSPHCAIFTLAYGTPPAAPTYIVAKGVRGMTSISPEDIRKYFVRVLHEVNTAYTVCHHPSIQRFFDIQIIHGVPFLLSRKRDVTLRELISVSPLSEAEALGLAVQIVHALNYCSRKGLACHQDLKPENIFVDSIHDRVSVPADYPLRWRIFLADFELANAFLVLGHPFGSRPYMAPEQYEKTTVLQPMDFSRTDVFAVGVILFEMVTGGLHPVGEKTALIWPTPAVGKSRKWLREDPWKQWLKRGAPISSSPCANPELMTIVQSCLNIDRAKRPSKELLEAQLLDRLRRVDQFHFDALSVTLAYFDQLAAESEEGGWPYYENRLDKLNKLFS